MRLWSLHPEYQDPRGLVALWREALWCRRFSGVKGAVMSTTLNWLVFGVRRRAIAAYLYVVYAEVERRGYHFDVQRIPSEGHVDCIEVTRGQLAYEREHLKAKLQSQPVMAD
jgi:Pyrimidine dimer DNA glycosylase